MAYPADVVILGELSLEGVRLSRSCCYGLKRKEASERAKCCGATLVRLRFSQGVLGYLATGLFT